MSGLRDGLTFIQAVEAEAPQLWGAGHGQIVWPSGEPLYVVGPTGVGKTTIMGQLALGRLGLRREVLGMPIEKDDRPVVAATRCPLWRRASTRQSRSAVRPVPPRGRVRAG
jgi:hypothetical protein